jgi:hypothetical protein
MSWAQADMATLVRMSNKSGKDMDISVVMRGIAGIRRGSKLGNHDKSGLCRNGTVPEWSGAGAALWARREGGWL